MRHVILGLVLVITSFAPALAVPDTHATRGEHATKAAQGTSAATDSATRATKRQSRMSQVTLTGTLPADMTSPEGKTRWDLTGLSVSAGPVRSITAGVLDGELVLDETGRSLQFRDEDDGVSARRWLMPDVDAAGLLRPGARELLELSEERVEDGRRGLTDHLRIEIEVVGIGWVHLPSGPREAVLQRALVSRQTAGSRAFSADRLVHRWVDPRAGVVAEISGPAAPNGKIRSSVDEASVLDKILMGASTLKIYVQELDDPVYKVITYGWDRGDGTKVGSLVPGGDPNTMTIGQLAAADTWDFSGNNTGVERASTTVPLTAAETCNAARCGYNLPGVELDREDRNFPLPASLDKINTVTQQEQRAGDVTIWLRAGAQHEGVTGGIGVGEARFCYTTVGTTTRTPVPQWRFPHQDVGGWYMQAGDPAWTSTPFNCEQNIVNAACSDGGGLFEKLWIKGNCSYQSRTHSGTQGGEILKAGVVTVPSGHTFNALLVRNVADFCLYLGSTCGTPINATRTTDYIWQIPHIGSVVRLQSAVDPVDTTSFTTLHETDIKFGLFPPRSITATGSTNTTVSLSWDPGLDTHRINAYRVHWDTDPGAVNAYAFNSIDNPGQASIVGTTATISGLTPGTTYYFTVTSRSTFTDPSSLIVTTYESLLYPTQVSGDPSFIYPTEVVAMTTSPTCIPTAVVDNLTVTHAAGNIEICWDPVTDPCLTGYVVKGALTPELPGNFTPVASVGLTTCWQGNPAEGFFLVVARGTGGNGP